MMHLSRRKLWKHLQQLFSTRRPLGGLGKFPRGPQNYLNLVILTILIKMLKIAKTKMCNIKLATHFFKTFFYYNKSTRCTA